MRLFVTLVALCCTLSLSAQIVVEQPAQAEQTEQPTPPRKEIRQALAETKFLDSLATISGKVVVREQGDAATIVDANLHQEAKAINGYRIVIFMSNKHSARQDAIATQQQFVELYPNEGVYLSYENPYFKVTVGNCLSAEEAVMLWNKVQGTFDRAFVIRENIPIEEITKNRTIQDTLLIQTINQF